MLETKRWFKDYHTVIEMGMGSARAIEANIFFRNRETRWGCHTCEYETQCLGFQPQKEAPPNDFSRFPRKDEKQHAV